MFVQVISARTHDPTPLRKLWGEWHELRAASLSGWAGSTAGVTSDSEFIAVIRFESAALWRQAQRELDVDPLWSRLQEELENVRVADCESVDTMLGGASNQAGFVQIVRGTARDVLRMRSLNEAMEDILATARPELIGTLICWHGSGEFVEAVYFTSEAEARGGESREFPGGLKAFSDELATLVGEISFADLTDPWHYSR